MTKKELESDPEVEDEDLKRAFSGRGHVISIYKKFDRFCDSKILHERGVLCYKLRSITKIVVKKI